MFKHMTYLSVTGTYLSVGLLMYICRSVNVDKENGANRWHLMIFYFGVASAIGMV